MNFNEYLSSMSHHYPEYVTRKEMAVIMGICESKAYSLEKQGKIPYEYTSTSDGKRQKIKTADILLYQYEQMCFNELENEYVEALRRYFEKQLKAYPNVLRTSDVKRLTGYVKTTINNWILRNELKALCYKNQRIKSPQRGKGTLIAKEAFINFLISPYYRNIVRKSALHKEQEQEYTQLFIRFLSKRGA
ncbi:MAG TPA: hypothetical protein PKD52_08875 [Clostridiales bacterium]|nr:hypothetical protein [Clostridiales bacterium]